jgi:putative endonuclease
VKTRTSNRFGAPIESITPVKLRRLRRLAAEFLAEARTAGTVRSGTDIRLDIASVIAERGRLVIDVTEGAW